MLISANLLIKAIIINIVTKIYFYLYYYQYKNFISNNYSF